MSDEASAPFGDSEVAKDTLFDLLSSPRRRFVLYYLHEENRTITLHDLADEVASWEYEKPIEDLNSQERKRVYVSLYQTHIPKLADSGIIDYDNDTGDITLTDHVNEFGPYLGWEQRTVPWQLYYLGFALVGAVFYGLVSFDVGPFALVNDLVAGLLVIVGFVMIATWQYMVSQRTSVRMPSELIDER